MLNEYINVNVAASNISQKSNKVNKKAFGIKHITFNRHICFILINKIDLYLI